MGWLIQQLVPATAFGWGSMLVQALAWPASAVIVAAMFRSEVRLVLERMVRLKYRNLEAEFRRDLAQAEELAAESAPRRLLDLPDESRRVIHELDGAPARPARPHPRAAIEAAWSELAAIDRAALAGSDRLLFDRLRQLHARVVDATDWEPSRADADRFADLARPLAARLRPCDR